MEEGSRREGGCPETVAGIVLTTMLLSAHDCSLLSRLSTSSTYE